MVKKFEWVFDLDDTLYSELDYVLSALDFVGNLIDKLYLTKNASQELRNLYKASQPDPIGAFFQKIGLPSSIKANVVSAMQAHEPNISLRQGAKELLGKLREQGIGFSILTDGRSITQRAKLAALDCLDAHLVCISEETGWSKPNPLCYEYFNTMFQGKSFIYVGDNPSKDFVTARQLGWTTIMLTDDGKNIHCQNSASNADNVADYVVNDLAALVEKINACC